MNRPRQTPFLFERLRLEPLEDRRLLAVLTVNTWLDVVDGATTNIASLLASPGGDGKVSLREAIQAANSTAGADTVGFDPTVFTSTGGAADHVINLALTQLDVSDALTIEGLGADKTVIDANSLSRILDLGAASQTFAVTLSGLWLREGRTIAYGEDGAGIRKLSLGGLVLDHCQITDCATEGLANGGGILAVDNVSLTSSTIARNAVRYGDGVSTQPTGGGGIAQLGGQLMVVNSTISSNSAKYLVIPGAGEWNGGGGIYLNRSSSLVLVSSTLAYNTGSGIAFDANGGMFPSIQISSSILAANQGEDIRPYSYYNELLLAPVLASQSFVSNAYFTTLTPGTPDASGNWIGAWYGGQGAGVLDAQLGPLGDYGGPTLTHSLQSGSPAINAGNNVLGLTFDQRGPGFTRVAGGTADMGAFEVQPPLSVDILDVAPDPRTAPVGSVVIEFSQPVISFPLSTLALTRNGGANLLTAAQTLTTANGGLTWSLGNLAGLTGGAGQYVLAFVGSVEGPGGSIVLPGANDSWTVDLASPTADIVDVTPDPRSTAVASVSIVFSEAVKGFDRSDLLLDRNGDGLGNLLTASQTLTTSDNKTWTLGNLTPLTGNDGQYTLSIKSSGHGITDLVGNPLSGAPSDIWTKSSDVTAPTADIVDVTPDPRNTAVASVSIVFSEAVKGFDRSDLLLDRNGDGLGNLLTTSQALTTSDNKTWTLGNLTPLTGNDGQYTLSFKTSGHGITDLVGNPLSGAPLEIWIKSADTTAPTADIVDVTPDPRNAAVATVTIVFSEAVKGFDRSDLNLDRAGDGLGNLLTAAQTLTTSDNKAWTLGNLTPLTGNDGQYTLSFKTSGHGITDLVGNPLSGAPLEIWIKSADTTAPTADIVDVTPDPRNTAVASVTIVFSEAVKGFDRSDLILDRNGDGLGNLLTASQTLTTSDNKTWTLGNLTPLTGNDGQYTLSFKTSGHGITDLVGNPLSGAPLEIWIKSAAALALRMLDAHAEPKTATVDEAFAQFA